MRRTFAATITVLLTAVSQADALTIHIPNDQPTLGAGLAVATTGDTLLIDCGTYFESSLDVPLGIVLRSVDGSPDCVVIDGGNARILSIDSGTLVVIEGMTFTNGSAPWGGAVKMGAGSVTFRDCRFINNAAAQRGGAVASFGGGSVVATFERCAFMGNLATFEGGAAVMTGGTARFIECVFADNTGGSGAALNCAPDVPVEVTGCTFSRNEGGGGVISVPFGSVAIHRSVIAFGVSTAAISCGSGSVSLSCCNLFGNTLGDFTGCATGQNGIMDNFSADPLFCDATHDDFTLEATSPCLPGNHPAGAACGQIGALPLGCTLVSVDVLLGPRSWATVKSAYRGRN